MEISYNNCRVNEAPDFVHIIIIVIQPFSLKIYLISRLLFF